MVVAVPVKIIRLTLQPEGEGSAIRDNATHQNLCNGFNTAFEALELCKITRVQS